MATKAVTYRPPQYLDERGPLPDPGWLLDTYLAVHRETFDRWAEAGEQPGWRASSLGQCLRSQTLARRGIPSTKPYDLKTYRQFAWGDEVHKWLKHIFWRLGLVVAEEFTLADRDLNVSGHADLLWTPRGFVQENDREVMAAWSDEWVDFLAILRMKVQEMFLNAYDHDVPDDIIGTEIKSAHSYSMQKMLNQGPQEAHRYQAGIYKHMAQTTPGDANPRWPGLDLLLPEADRWFITYMGKDAVGTLTFEVEDVWVEAAVARCQELNRFWNKGLLPICSCVDWQVEYCSYNEGKECCGRNMKGKVAKALRKGA